MTIAVILANAVAAALAVNATVTIRTAVAAIFMAAVVVVAASEGQASGRKKHDGKSPKRRNELLHNTS